jgi:aspartate carbamoyltransferase catalytic subunit
MAALGMTRDQFSDRIGTSRRRLDNWLLPSDSKGFREMDEMARKFIREILSNLPETVHLAPATAGSRLRSEIMAATKDENLKMSKRDILVSEHLCALGIMSIEDAPDELIDEAHEEADKILGKGKDN